MQQIDRTARRNSRQGARMRYVDIAKGLGILMVITGHVAIRLIQLSRTSEWVFISIFSVHMPLFFVLAGYVFSRGRSFSLKKESERLLLPYLVTALLCVFLLTFQALLTTHSLTTASNVGLSWLNATVYASGGIFEHPLWPQDARIGAIWFLFALFWAKLVMSFATHLPHGWIVCLICFVLAVFSMRYVWLPFSIQAGFAATPFMWLGMKFRELRAFEKPLPPILGCIFVLIWIVAISLKNPIAMAASYFGELPFDLLIKIAGAASAIICITKLSQMIEKHIIWLAGLFEILGQASLAILCTHLVLDNVIDWGWVVSYLHTERQIVAPVILLGISLVRMLIEASLGLVVHRLWTTQVALKLNS